MTIQEYVKGELGPFHADIGDIYSRAWKRYEKIPPDLKPALVRDARTIAGVMWALVTDEAIKHFIPLDVVPRARHGTWEFPIRPNICLRFKKTSANGKTSNYRTPRSVAYDHGLPLEDVPELIRVTAGWVPNKDMTGIADLLVSMRGPQPWFYSILPTETGELEMFIAEESSEEETSQPLVKPRHIDIGTIRTDVAGDAGDG